MLRLNGLNQGDYSVQSIGATGYRLDAIKKGEIDFTMLNLPFNLFAKDAGMNLEVCEDRHFFTTVADFAAHAKGRKSLRLEYFYRELRQRFDILMDGKQPVGGQWNFDADNRKPWPGTPAEPADWRTPHDHSALWATIEAAGVTTFGEPQAERLAWDTPFTEVLDWSKAPFAKWFVGGTLNVAYNCVDRHVESGHGDQVVLPHHEGFMLRGGLRHPGQHAAAEPEILLPLREAHLAPVDRPQQRARRGHRGGDVDLDAQCFPEMARQRLGKLFFLRTRTDGLYCLCLVGSWGRVRSRI